MQKKLLYKIDNPKIIKNLSERQLSQLCSELREEIIETVSKNGGHLSSNLGTVELTAALLKSFDVPKDRIVWDVGHQCYSYKLLTGRLDNFSTLRTAGGLSGYPKTSESNYDSFAAGHSSTSIAAAYGIERGNRVTKTDGYVVAVIGDGAMTGGLVYEAINNVGKDKSKLIVIINDNDMSISKSEGALARYLTVLRGKPAYFKAKEIVNTAIRGIPAIGNSVRDGLADIKYGVKQMMYPSTFFEQFGFDYMGPVDGHNIQSICDVLAEAKRSDKPVILHIKTVKGKGYKQAEKHPGEYHGVGKFDPCDGIDLRKSKKDFSSEFGRILLDEAKKDSSIVAVTAAMEDSTGLGPFAQQFKSKGRFFDVGIAESFATTFCGGMASVGAKPVFAVYSTFLQRAYDQILHDCAIEPRNVVFAVDRAGLVGNDGETHQGIFDVSFFSAIPSTTIYSPSNYLELEVMLKKALHESHPGPIAVRYPRGAEPNLSDEYSLDGSDFLHIKAKDNCQWVVITYGKMFEEAVKLREKTGCGIIKLGKIHPIPNGVVELALGYEKILFAEEGIKTGSIGMQLSLMLMEAGYKGKYCLQSITDFVPQGTVEECIKMVGLDCDSLLLRMKEV